MNLQDRRVKAILSVIGMGSVLALAACTANEAQSGATQVATATPPAQHSATGAVPGGMIREGGTVASMADQYAHPRLGPVAGAGASAWVQPAPPPAFVATGPMPAADAPPPQLAAVANRQPSNPAPTPAPAPAPAVTRQPSAPAPARGADAADLVRPEAAAPDAPAAAPAQDPAVRTAGLKLFNDYSCSACHSLADAKAGGSIGPSLDRNSRLTKAYVLDILNNGRGAMPSFAGQMTDAELGTLAEYIVQFSRK
ncbi:MAG: cytochrome c [Porphyrobacter sp.]|nr:cytochrome c [Porphyrobacter sp.]